MGMEKTNNVYMEPFDDAVLIGSFVGPLFFGELTR